MPTEPGQMLSHYRLIEKIGEGGMGVVWKALDTILDRKVAIKVLPEAFAADIGRLARFEREAKLLASLNHPNIASVYGLHQADQLRFLALELVRGESLAQRLARGPVPLEESLGLAIQIAEALEAAHENGVVHRDLKPANIQLTPEGAVKVLDFGLAKAHESAPPSAHLTASPTMTSDGTLAGVILGTAAYMSPEQVRGRSVDKRGDIWSFGCVLYEMLAGRRAFVGDTVSDTLAKILEREPDWGALPADTPGDVHRLLRRCLRRDARDRLHDVADARIAMAEILAKPVGEPIPAKLREDSSKRLRTLPWIIAAVATLALLFLAWWVLRDSRKTPTETIRLSAQLPRDVGLNPQGGLDLSSDGSRLVVDIERSDGTTQLYLRDLTGDAFTPMPGTEGASWPFFSPDGEWVGFTDLNEAMLKKVSVAGGAPVPICDDTIGPGGSWGRDGSIVFTKQWSHGLWRVPASGGTPEPLATAEASQEFRMHVWPQVLPGGSGVLYTSAASPADDSRLVVYSLETGEQRTVVEGAYFGRYVSTGHLLYLRGKTLFAQPFDLEQLEPTAPRVPVLDGIAIHSDHVSGMLAVALNGTLAYVPHAVLHPPERLLWVNRDGTEQPAADQPGEYGSPTLSPDGQRLALHRGDTAVDVWIHEFARGTATRLTLERPSQLVGIWTPDGRRVIYARSSPQYDLWWRPADGTGAEELLYSDARDKLPNSISPDGNTLVFHYLGSPKTRCDIWQLSLTGQREPVPLVQTPFDEWGGVLSPDGRWLAFTSNESGRAEVYVQAFLDPSGKVQVSTDGGLVPVWSRDGTELFYRNGDRVMAVAVETRGKFNAGRPHALFEGRYKYDQYYRHYDVAADGRFLMIKIPGELIPQRVHVVTNWFEELKRSAPTVR